MYKSKIFVRYVPGSSGNFVSLVLHALMAPVSLIESNRAHKNNYDYNKYHNFATVTQDPTFQIHTRYPAYKPVSKSVEWLQNNVEFYNTPLPAYIAHTHSVNPDALVKAFDAKLVNISFGEHDLDQIAYNWITKSCIIYEQWESITYNSNNIKNKYNRLLDTKVDYGDLKLLTYIQKFGADHFNYTHHNFMYDVFTIKFADIMDGALVNCLENLIDYIGIDVKQDRIDNAVELIEQYSRSQKIVPWKQQIEEYN